MPLLLLLIIMKQGLPFLPGNTFRDSSKHNFHVAQTLRYRNGYRIPKVVTCGLGNVPIIPNQSTESKLNELAIHCSQAWYPYS